MRAPTGGGLFALLSCLLLYLCSGCAGVDPLVVKEREVNELRFQAARMRDSISELLGVQEALSDQLRSEKATFVELDRQRSDVSSSLLLANEQIASLSAERSKLQSELQESEDLGEQFQQSLKRVQTVASSSAGELTDLRVTSRELEERLAQLTGNKNSLGEENARMTQELEKVQAELVRTRAVARSLQEGKEPAATAVNPAVTAELERERDNLQGETVALKKRIEQLENKLDEAHEETVAEATGPFYQADPDGLLGELKLMTVNRYEDALQGSVAWDKFDVTVISVAGVFLLFFFLLVLRWGRTRQLKKEVRNLRMSLQELEETAVSLEVEESSPRSAVSSPVSRVGRKPPRRRSGFSAVISNSDVGVGSEPAAVAATEGPVSEKDADLFEQVMDSAGPVSSEAIGKAPRKVIGAGVWPDKAAGETSSTAVSTVEAQGDGEESLANTQIMPSFTEVELQGGSLADALKPASSQLGKSKKVDADAGDKEILSELKTVINRKFDELLK